MPPRRRSPEPDPLPAERTEPASAEPVPAEPEPEYERSEVDHLGRSDRPEVDRAVVSLDDFMRAREPASYEQRARVEDPRKRPLTTESPFVDATNLDAAAMWDVRFTNPDTGEAEDAGQCSIYTTRREFYRRYLAFMPRPGEISALFLFYPLDELGRRLSAYQGNEKPYNTRRIAANNVELAQVRREVEAEQRDEQRGGGGGAQDAFVRLLTEQLRASEARAAAAEAARLEQLQADAVGKGSERAMLGASLAEQFGAVTTLTRSQAEQALTWQREQGAKVIEQQSTAAMSWQERQERAHQLELERIRADAEAKKAEAADRIALAKIEMDAKLELARIAAKEAAAERIERMTNDAAERAERLRREEAALEARRLELKDDARLERERIDREEARRLTASENEEKRRQEHTALVLQLLTDRQDKAADAARPLGAVEDLLDKFGVSLPVAAAAAVAFVKDKLDNLSGGGSIGETLIKEAGQTLRTFVEAGGGDPENLEEPEPERRRVSEEPEVEPERRAPPKRKRPPPIDLTNLPQPTGDPIDLPKDPIDPTKVSIDPAKVSAPVSLSSTVPTVIPPGRRLLTQFVEAGQEAGNWFAAAAQATPELRAVYAQGGAKLLEDYKLDPGDLAVIDDILAPKGAS